MAENKANLYGNWYPEWMKTGELHEFVSYYAKWLEKDKSVPSLEDV